MSRNFRYFYRVNTKGEPVPGSNVKSTGRPQGAYYRQLTPQSAICCADNPELQNSSDKSTKFFVRLNEENKPISGTLRKMKYRPDWGKFQEVFTDNCCPVSSIEVLPATADIAVDGTVNLVVTATYASGRTQVVTSSATYVSADELVATVVSGVVTGTGGGTTNITVTFGGATDVSAITVTAPIVAVTGVSVLPATANLAVAATQQLTETISPISATDQTVIWSTSDALIATVSVSGLVTAVAVGSATITCTTTDGGFTDTCVVTVA